MEAGQQVRLRDSPDESGTVTQERRTRGQRLYVGVNFRNGLRLVPVDQLEPVKAGETPSDLLKAGRLSGVSHLRRAIIYRRLSGKLDDVIYSMEATNTDFYPYQFKPVLKLLASPTNGLLIADEVGLGKTIEAGLIWTELRARYDMRRLFVVCPAALREKWRFELRSKLGVDADIVDAKAALSTLRDAETEQRGFAMIASMQGLRPPKGWRDADHHSHASAQLAAHLREHENNPRLIDLLVIDEAHHLRNPETATHQLGQLLREVSEYRLLLTATPVHNKNRDLFSVLKLLDPDTFRVPEYFDEILEANEPLVRARDEVLAGNCSGAALAEELARASTHRLLHGNRQLGNLREQLEGEGSIIGPELRSRIAYRLESANLLANTVTRTRKRDVQEFRVVREPVPQFIPMTEVERSFYEGVTNLIRDYAVGSAVNQHFLLATPQRQLTSSMVAALRLWQARQVQLDEIDALSGDASVAELGPIATLLAREAPKLATVEELMARDTKYERLETRLLDVLGSEPATKLVVFSAFPGTLEYLSERLAKVDISTIVLSGMRLKGTAHKTKDEVIEVFSDSQGPSVLLSSEVGAEGIDLQFSRILVNYDLPWNPMRLEQRIGRLDRLGQEADQIAVWNLLHEETIDERIYRRLYEKLDLCRRSLGDFDAVLGKKTRELSVELLSGRLSPEQEERRIDQTAQALENLNRETEELERKAAHLLAHGDYILRRVHQAQEMHRWISGEDVRSYVLDFFRANYPGCDFRRRDDEDLVYEISLSNGAKMALEQHVEANGFVRTRLTDTRPGPLLCRFVHRTTGGKRTHEEAISQFHPVVRFVSERLGENDEDFRPASGARLDANVAGVPEGIYLVAASFWSVGGLQPVERLAFAGSLLTGAVWKEVGDETAERLVLAAAQHGRDWAQVRHDVVLGDAFREAESAFERLVRRYEEFVAEMRAKNEDRADIQERNLRNHLEHQRDTLQSILEQQRRAESRIAPATAGRITKLENRVDRELLKIRERRRLTSSQDETLVTLVLADGGNGG
jgi:superfamily II DNA or RNA helicase